MCSEFENEDFDITRYFFHCKLSQVRQSFIQNSLLMLMPRLVTMLTSPTSATNIDVRVFSRTIDQIYVDDPKKAFNPDWESIAPVVHENQEWKRDLKHVSSRKKFVEEMINIKTGSFEK